jgi:hypothetical protein
MLNPITEDTEVLLFPDVYVWDEDELEKAFVSYVRIGDGIVGCLRDGSAWIYTRM